MVAKVVPIITAREAKKLWDNARDSIFHALEHFFELSLKNGEESVVRERNEKDQA